MKSKRTTPLMFTDPSAQAGPIMARTGGAASDSAMEALLEPAALGALSGPPATAPRRRRAGGSKSPKHDELGLARFAYPAAAIAALVWVAGLAAFVVGFQSEFQSQFGVFDYSPLQWAEVALLALLPATFIVLSAFALRQGARLAAETRRTRALAEDFANPTALAMNQASGGLETIRREIEKAGEAAVAAREPILALREALATEGRRLSEAAAHAEETGRLLTETIGRERSALGEIAGSLQLQAAEAAEALARQARVVAEASDLAQAQLDEAQASLTARAAGLALAAGDARHAAETASETLLLQVERLETTGAAVGDRVQTLSAGLGAEREQLSNLSDTLRADQEDLSVRLETQRAQLAEAAADVRDGAASLAEASNVGADALRELIATAAQEVRRLAETAQFEQAELDARAHAAVGLFSGMVAEERAAIEAQTRAALGDLATAAEEARLAAAGHVEAAAVAAKAHAEAARTGLDRMAEDVAAKIDGLGEAAFVAGQKADQVFDTRLAAARRAIDQSAALMEETGERSAQRLEQGLATARSAVSEMDGLLAEIDQRMALMPDQARVQAAAVRDAVETGVSDLTAAARRAAEETQAIDAAFQDRVRRNYEVLSDAVRLMGQVAGAADLARPARTAPAAPEAPLKPAAPVIKPAANGVVGHDAPAPERSAAQPERIAMPELRTAVAGADRGLRISLGSDTAGRMTDPAADMLRPAALSDPHPEGHGADRSMHRAETLTAAAAGLRPRLRLTTPPPADSASLAPPAEATPRAAPPAEPPVADEWTWKELLTSMDDTADDDEALADRLIAEIGALGVDASALLPRVRIDEIAAALQAGDASGAREVVRRLAPAAVRRLSRRVLTDKILRGEADRYVRRYEELLGDAARRDREGYMTAALLGSDPGRAFLLLDAAVGDLH